MLYRIVTTLDRPGIGVDVQTILMELIGPVEARRAGVRALCEMIGDFGPEGAGTFAIEISDTGGHIVYAATATYRQTTPS